MKRNDLVWMVVAISVVVPDGRLRANETGRGEVTRLVDSYASVVLNIEDQGVPSGPSISAPSGNELFPAEPEVPVLAPGPASAEPVQSEARIPLGFQWKRAAADSFRFLMLQNVARVVVQGKTRRELPGSFFSDYLRTLRTPPSGFGDGDGFLTNFLGHPVQGSTTYHIARINGASHKQAFWWGVAYSTHFEGGLVGEAGIGNVVVSPVDLVMTPVAGYYLGIAEEWLQGRIDNIERPKLRTLTRILLAGRFLARLSSGR